MSAHFETTYDATPRVYILHENDAWVVPLRHELDILGVPYAEWFLDRGILDLSAVPPEGLFYNRMSASSHTRGHRYGPELTASVLAWLKRHRREVVNGERAIQLEVSKVAQYEALKAFDIPVPATVAVVGSDNIPAAAERIGYPLIFKHNRAGKGLGVQLIFSRPALIQHLDSASFEESVDGIMLLQRYIKAPEPYITRVEFIGGRLLYAVRVDTSEGFELCPADACVIDASSTVCPADARGDKFQIIRNFDHPLIRPWQAFLAANDIQIAGIEFIADAQGNAWTYDVNTNTNYNSDAEAKDGRRGMGAAAAYFGQRLAERYGPLTTAALASKPALHAVDA